MSGHNAAFQREDSPCGVSPAFALILRPSEGSIKSRGLDQYSRKVQRHGRVTGDQQERPGTGIRPVTWAEQEKRGSDLFLRVRRLGVRVPPSAPAGKTSIRPFAGAELTIQSPLLWLSSQTRGTPTP